MDGRVVVRDPWKVLLCKMSGCSKMLIKVTHAHAKGHPEKHDASEGRHGSPKQEEPCSARVEVCVRTSRQSGHSCTHM